MRLRPSSDIGIDTVVGIYAFFIVLSIWLGGWSTQYTVEYWASFIQHHPVHVPFLPCAIAGLFLATVSVPAAMLTWVLSFVIH